MLIFLLKIVLDFVKLLIRRAVSAICFSKPTPTLKDPLPIGIPTLRENPHDSAAIFHAVVSFVIEFITSSWHAALTSTKSTWSGI
jgi:hypothetical protein